MRASKLANLSSISLLSASRESLDGDGGGLLDFPCFAEGVIKNVLKIQFISYNWYQIYLFLTLAASHLLDVDGLELIVLLIFGFWPGCVLTLPFWKEKKRKVRKEKLLLESNLIKLCSACAKQNATVKNASDVCSMFFQRPSSFIFNFQQVYYEIVFSFKYLCYILVPVADCTLLQE